MVLALTHPPLFELALLPLSLSTHQTNIVNADAIVVLGGGIDDDGLPGLSTMTRTYLGGELLLSGKAPLLILSSGATNDSTVQSEASAMQKIALGIGIPESKIILEDKSSNTYTNAVKTQELLRQYNINSIIIVTSYAHKYRAYRVFEKLGIQVNSVVGTKKLKLSSIGWERAIEFRHVLYEYLAIILYKYKGWM